MADKQLRLVLVGDATSVQRALRAMDAELAQTNAAISKTGQNLAQNEAKVESFGKAFAKLGLAVGAAALLKEAAQGVEDYTKKIQESSSQILGITKSQTALNQAFAFGESELKAGRAAYSDTVAAIAELTPVAQRASLGVTDLYRTVQLLSALNSGPGGGVEGSVIAINNALAGQFTSLQERFNLPIAGIQAAVKAGVPVLQAINDALAKEGVTMDLVTAKSKTAANQQKILFDTLAKLGSDSGGKEGLDLYTTALVGLNKELQSPAVKEFAVGLRELVELASTGELFQDFGLQTAKSFYLIGDAFNNLIKAISGGKLNADGPLAAFRAQIVADEGKLRTTVRDKIGKPVADELSGKGSGSPLAPAAMQGYGRDVVESYLRGLSSASVDEVQKIVAQFGDLFKDADGKDDKAKISNAYVVITRALNDLARQGQLTDETMLDLSSTFGLQTPEVYKLITAYTQYQQALSGVALANTKVAGSQAGVSVVTAQAAGETKRLEVALGLATAAAQANAAATEGIVGHLQDTLKGVHATAEEAARAGQAQLAGLQGGLDDLQQAASQHAAARQSEINAAQAALSAASQQRQNDQALLNAAISGELEYEEQILDGLTDEQRARAAVWQAEIDGQRRAKEGADQALTKINRQANKENLDYLERIDAARKSGNEKEARRLERELAARQKSHQAETEIARARAAVADDEFDAAKDRVEKEGKDQEVKDTQAEKAAQANLTRIQNAAAAQSAADDAAIKAKQDEIKQVQAAQKAEQDRYAAQERGIQREIDKTTEAAKVQAAKDKQTIDDAQTILDNRKKFWDQEITQAELGATQAGNQAKSAQNFADRMKDALDYAEKISKLDFSNVTNAANALAQVPKPSNVSPILPGGNSPYDETPPSQAPSGPPQGPRGAKPLLGAIPGAAAPNGYHAQRDNTGQTWWVPDGYTLSDFGKTPAGNAPSNNDSLESAGVSPAFLRAGGQQGGGEGNTTIIIHAPNLRDIRDKRDLNDLGAHLERTWKDIRRGGRVKREVGS